VLKNIEYRTLNIELRIRCKWLNVISFQPLWAIPLWATFGSEFGVRYSEFGVIYEVRTGDNFTFPILFISKYTYSYFADVTFLLKNTIISGFLNIPYTPSGDANNGQNGYQRYAATRLK